MQRKFKSLAHPELGYAYDSQPADFRAAIEPHFRVFQTYGDGITQHSMDTSVGIELLTDYLASLTAAMLEDNDLATETHYILSRRPTEQALKFAASVVYRPGKTRYFSLDEMKVSASDSKRHDKRYFEIDERHDGSPHSMFRILTPEYSCGLQTYAYTETLRDWLIAQRGEFMELPATFLKWFDEDRERARELHHTFTVCRDLAESARLRENAERAVASYKELVAKPVEVAA